MRIASGKGLKSLKAERQKLTTMKSMECKKIAKLMLKKAKAMSELSESSLPISDTEIDIATINKNEYVWMLRSYGTKLISLDELVSEEDIKVLNSFNDNIRNYYHIVKGNIDKISKENALELVSKYL